VSSFPDTFDPYATLRHTAPSIRTAPRGYYIVRQLLVLGAVVGGLAALYRNDVFRDASRRLGQEEAYLRVESALFGSPGWGTPRSMESVLATGPVVTPTPPAPVGTTAPAEASVDAAPAATMVAPPPAAAPAVAAAPAPQGDLGGVPVVSAAALAPAGADPLAPVSLDALPVAQSRSAAAVAATGAARAVKISLDDAPSPASPAPAKAKAAPPKPAEPEGPRVTEARATDNPLTAAIRGAERARPPPD
jgi:hypothetical protein